MVRRLRSSSLGIDLIKEWWAFNLINDGVGVWKPFTIEWSN
jgi:hypothetical protein